MLWPFMPNRAQRSLLFATLAGHEPDFFVHRWGEYKSDVPNLRPEEIGKIDHAADAIVASFATPFPVRAILLQGHADYDFRRFGQEREDFELRISRSRAREVCKHLHTSIEPRLFASEQWVLYALLFWKEEGLGSHQRVTTAPRNEYERSLNRRVEVFTARAARPLWPASVMTCPHGGSVTRGPFARGLPSPKDRWIVVGCRNEIFNGIRKEPSPCITVQWLIVNDEVIDTSSVGECLGPRGERQGRVIISG